jgi:FixJ family two-component response regulator
VLTRLGYGVDGYTDPEEALAAFAADPGRYAVVVTDMNMPGRSGISLATALIRTRPGIPVVLLSGYVAPGMRDEAARAGIGAVLGKPLSVTELSDAVRDALRR